MKSSGLSATALGVWSVMLLMLPMAITCPARGDTIAPVVAYPVAVPGAVQTYARDIDGIGVVGQYFGSPGRGFYYDGSSYTTLTAPSATGDTDARGISGDTIVGTYFDTLNTFGFSYSINNQTWATVTYPGATDTYVNGIDGSRMVGSWSDGTSGGGFFYNGSVFTSLSGTSLGATQLSVNAIHGNFIGGDYDTSGGRGPTLAFLYEISTETFSPFVLPFAEVTSASIAGISEDWITGSYSDGSSDRHAFIYGRHSGEAWSVDAPNAVFGSYGGGVSGNKFVVNGFDGNGDNVSMVYMAPVPEPSTYCLTLAGLACGGFSMWRRKRA